MKALTTATISHNRKMRKNWRKKILPKLAAPAIHSLWAWVLGELNHPNPKLSPPAQSYEPDYLDLFLFAKATSFPFVSSSAPFLGIMTIMFAATSSTVCVRCYEKSNTTISVVKFWRYNATMKNKNINSSYPL